MAKASITFSLPEEKTEHLNALHGGLYKAVIYQLDLWLRNLAKHNSRDIVETKEVREKITELMGTYGLESSD